MRGLFLIVAATGVLIVSCIYLFNMRERAVGHYAGQSVSDMDGGLYRADYYATRLGDGFLRLHRASDNALLAERMFGYGDTINLFWKKDMLIYDSNDQSFLYDGGVDLPPRWIDRMLAKLP